ncbi:MAG: AAA-like domain-containing protein [Lachnospiraceae bacterium]|nr:AAA-like domain-containing protein [Lachnospiraceae bacterium]
MKRFNTTGVCIPEKHYMVDLTDRVREIKKLVDDGKYFTIIKARQYGKTTTLSALEKALCEEYDVISIDFQDVTGIDFVDEYGFVRGLAGALCDVVNGTAISASEENATALNKMAFQNDEAKLSDIFRILDSICKEAQRPVVLMIDEVDTAANNQVFLDFLGKLRSGYIKREKNPTHKTFQSVILAGVTDVKHLKRKIRDEDQHKVNSPWNIAADFDIDMSLSEPGIKGMLDEYESDHHTGMDTGEIAKQIRAYTSGYPYLVSRICQKIDENLVPEVFGTLSEVWTVYGVDEAVKQIVSEENTLFDSVMGKLINYPELKQQLRRVLLRGETIAYVPDNEEQKQLKMYGFIVNHQNSVAISNRIFEMRLYNYFIGESRANEELKQSAAASRSIFVNQDGWLDVPKIMDHFIREHNRIHGENTERFVEAEGRERFITYISGIINGTGTYSVEEQTRDQKRTDLVIHYHGRRYVIELKIWRGERYNADGEKQILEYLDYFGLDTGYLLSFNFNQKKTPGVERIQIGGKTIFEGIV